MLGNMLNDLAEAIRLWTEKNIVDQTAHFSEVNLDEFWIPDSQICCAAHCKPSDQLHKIC